MVTIITSMEVKNYDDFKKSFDTHEVGRTKGGIKATGVYSSVENPNHVTIISEAESAEVAQAFMSSPDLKPAMENAGTVSKPEIKMLCKVQ